MSLSEMDIDIASQMLIAELLNDELNDRLSSQYAEHLQANELSAVELHEGGTTAIPQPEVVVPPVDDFELALRLSASDTRACGDAALAAKYQLHLDANFTAGRQYAKQVAAGEAKLILDAEYARRVQAAYDDGAPEDVSIQEVDRFLSADTISNIMSMDPNFKGKGKAKATTTAAPEPPSVVEQPSIKSSPATPYTCCGICMEPFQPTNSPIAATTTATSHDRVAFGLFLPCPGSHGYCISCLSTYITSKLDPDEDGGGRMDIVVFPLLCPECSSQQWPQGIEDGVAERVLGERAMGLWHHRKLLDSQPRYFCPNPRCSALVEVEENPDDPQAECPACRQLLCIPCRSPWHDGISCEDYQSIPLEDRSPDDLLALQVIKAHNWRRCPKCSYIVELVVGCNHITCRCKTEFCFKCGSLWDTAQRKCSQDPNCALWDEEMLLEVRERNRQRPQLPGADAGMLPPPPQLDIPPPYAPEEARHTEFDWLTHWGMRFKLHEFTHNMVKHLQCGYCGARVQSLRELEVHLSMAYHPTYACCHRFFRTRTHFHQHQMARTRLGYHQDAFARD